MNQYCTYFDRNFLIQGLALAESLRTHDADHLLWVLCLDGFTYEYLLAYGDKNLRPVSLDSLEAADPALINARANRTPIEYYFTLSPCWPRYLLKTYPEIACVTYLDADLFLFGSPQAIFEEMGTRSILITEQRYPKHLSHRLRCGQFNVGILAFKNDDVGLSCLDRWRDQCLAWCKDEVSEGRYADQGYLQEWPALYGAHLCVCARPGVNLAPWNWESHRIKVRHSAVLVDNHPLEIFHFSRFHPQPGGLIFQSGQLEYGIMSWSLRQAIYIPYYRALQKSRARIRTRFPEFNFSRKRLRGWHAAWRSIVPRVVMGSDWFLVGPYFVSGRFGLGRFSGHIIAFFRRLKATVREKKIEASASIASSLGTSADRAP